MFKCSNVQMFKCSNVQMFKCSNVQMFKCSNISCSNVSKVKLLSEHNSGVPSVSFFFFKYSPSQKTIIVTQNKEIQLDQFSILVKITRKITKFKWIVWNFGIFSKPRNIVKIKITDKTSYFWPNHHNILTTLQNIDKTSSYGEN